MRVAVFTSNQPRHIALLEALAQIADEVIAVQECTTVAPGAVADLHRKSQVMQRYFERVLAAERAVFAAPRPTPPNVRTLALRLGDLNLLDSASLAPLLTADYFVVFGASYIRGELCRRLVERRAVNLHMGVSPQYRGSSTNFWALYDRRPQYVGATLHLLTAGLDSGPILAHALPPPAAVDPFLLGMHAVRAAHAALIEMLQSGRLERAAPVPQDRRHELRYTRSADFTDAIAAEYLERLATPIEIEQALRARRLSEFVQPFVPAASADHLVGASH